MNIIGYLLVEILYTVCQVLWCDWFLILKRRNNGVNWYIRFGVLSVLSYLSQQIKPENAAPVWANVYLILILIVLYECSIKQLFAYVAWLVTLGLLTTALSMAMVDAMEQFPIIIKNELTTDLGSRIMETAFTVCSCYIL